MIVVGFLASALLALCALPAVWSALAHRQCAYDPWFLRLWTAGEVLGLVYVVWLGDLPLIANYGLNLLCCLVLLRYNK